MSEQKINLPISQPYRPFLEFVRSLGDFQKEAFNQATFKIKTKSSEVDMVTEIDLESDRRIVSFIKDMFPQDHILSEEQGSHKGTSSYTWIIDPLDGTTNFSIGHPIFAISIARWEEQEPVFGVVYLPMLDMLYVAEKGKGAYANGKKLEASHQVLLKQSVLGTGFPYDRASAVNANGDNIRHMIPLVKGIRRLGAAAYDLCLVASGVYDGFWELRLSKWDLAAGRLMIQEAGGYWYQTVEDDKYNVITGSEEICKLIKQIVNLDNHKRG